MRIESFQVKNYKCFRETDPVNLADGFNIVVAPNNVGKTALLEILSTRFEAKPHRTIKIPRQQALNRSSSITIELCLTGGELENLARRQSQIFIPIEKESQIDQNRPTGLIRRIFASKILTVRSDITNKTANLISIKSKHYSLDLLKSPTPAAVFNLDSDSNTFQFATVVVNAKIQDSLLMRALEEFRSSTYNFLAERLNIGACNFGAEQVLKPNAANLAEVLDNLQSNNPARFDKFNEHISQIFPNIHRVISRPSRTISGTVEIVVWTVDPQSERDDLAMELKESGTGIGQVLAILYVVITSNQPRVIIIDEPNTFLHPGAARKLVEILREYPQHQYIFSTHSPEVIRMTDPGALIAVSWEDGQSKLEPMDTHNIEQMRAILIDVGAKLSDVFGADNIFWVEGPTEEECFLRILRKLGTRPLLGTSIVAVRTTGEFQSKRADATAIWEIYERLSSGVALLPQAIAFVFDREGRSETVRADLSRRSGGRVRFLPRRMYENYLLNPNAITALLNSFETFTESPVEESAVHEWLTANGGNKRYCGSTTNNNDLGNVEWLTKVHGAMLLSNLVKDLSANKEEYRKRSHSVWLTEWLLENQAEAFSELRDFLDDVLTDDQ
jgi:AAA15 family ATPase/GTPase